MDSHELYHYGIKGQRWGVRRFQKKNGSLTPAGKKRQKEKWSEDATEASKIKKKSVNAMSNAELKRLNERTRLEQEYSRLNPSNRKKAIAAVTATAATMGTLLNLYNNSDKLIEKGRPIAQKLINPIARKAKDAMAIGLWSDIHSDELYHYGIVGMKWGKRKARGHAGPGKYATKNRQLAGNKRDLEGLNNGQHLSVGFTKKRQAAFDARDKAALEKMSKKRYDKADQDYMRKVGFDLSSASSKKKAGREIEEHAKLWKEYWRESNKGTVDNEKTRALKQKYDQASLDMYNALVSDLPIPSGRTVKYIRSEEGKLIPTFI